LYKSQDRHLVSSSWWYYFARHDPSPECFLPEQQREGQVDIFYARWWSQDNQVFLEYAGRIKEAESAQLTRADVPVAQISSSFLHREFPTLTGTALDLKRRNSRVQTFGQVDRKACVGALKPLVRPDSSLTTSNGSSALSSVYSWWRHFLLDCGYPAYAALSSPILPGSFNNDLWREWERHIRHLIARVGPVEFISQVESGTRLLDFWGTVVGAGNVVKIPPEKVVLPPTFSPAPSASFITLTVKQKQNASYNQKRRVSKEVGPLQPVTRGRASRPSPSDGAALRSPRSADLAGATPTPCDDANPLADDDYNPTFDGTPSSDAADLTWASLAEQGRANIRLSRAISQFYYCCLGSNNFLPFVFFSLSGHAPASIIAGEGAGCPDVPVAAGEGSPSLQAVHDLLTSGPETGLPGYSDFNFIESDERAWPHVLHSVMAISSTVELPTASPPEEGEIPRRTNGESDDTVCLIMELMEASPAAASPPSVAGVVGAEMTSRDAVAASSLPGAREPLPVAFGAVVGVAWTAGTTLRK
ncbi:hypothetical protein Taro_027689, partial [Colocasia esculenta]|nr:hypothetical protein [Colocasia esculenta]